MPKVILEDGLSVQFHPVVIRFTHIQKERLTVLSRSLGVSMNSLVRTMVDHELSIYEKTSSSLTGS